MTEQKEHIKNKCRAEISGEWKKLRGEKCCVMYCYSIYIKKVMVGSVFNLNWVEDVHQCNGGSRLGKEPCTSEKCTGRQCYKQFRKGGGCEQDCS
jgi:hypothetical protein